METVKWGIPFVQQMTAKFAKEERRRKRMFEDTSNIQTSDLLFLALRSLRTSVKRFATFSFD